MMRFMNVSTAATIIYSLPNKLLDDSISVIEVFADKKFNSTNYFGVDRVANFYTNWYYGYQSGAYYELDNYNRLYLSDYTSYYEINVLNIWTHNQYFSADGICIPTQNNFLTFEVQDTQQTAWIDTSITSNYNLTLVNDLCNYSCSEGNFGPRWEDWDAYMNRKGESAATYYKYVYDQSSKACIQVYDNEYWSKHTYWLECFRQNGWSFLNNKCIKNSRSVKNFDPYDYIKSCPLGNHSNPIYWGKSDYDLKNEE